MHTSRWITKDYLHIKQKRAFVPVVLRYVVRFSRS